MSIQDIIRAWKDANYRSSLSEHEQALLPAKPAGAIALTDEDLGMVVGGSDAGVIAEAYTDVYSPACPTAPQ